LAKRTDKTANRVKSLYDSLNNSFREKWEATNQQGYDFYLDNQLSAKEKEALEETGMPTFTINRVIPVVEMLNYYATASDPRWQAVGVEGSDSGVAAVFSDIADYIWSNSDGQSLYSNVVNDAITKSVGYLLVTVDPNADNGMGEVVIQQPEPFDIFVDPKSRDPLFRDAAHVMIRKVFTRTQLLKTFPQYAAKIKRASANYGEVMSQSLGATDTGDIQYKDITEGYTKEGGVDEMIELFELYEKEQVKYYNIFYRVIPSEEEMAQITQNVELQIQEMQKEMAVEMKEMQFQMSQAVEMGEMLPERMALEIEKQNKMNQEQLASAKQQLMAEAQKAASIVQNNVVNSKEYKVLIEDENFSGNIVDIVEFYKPAIKQSCVAGDVTLYETELPTEHYPLVPFTYKWSGTPYPMSAVSPLVGKQREINKAHQLMIHNASLGSSLRWMYFEGSIDTDYWEKNATAPGALLPVNQGFDQPKEVQPAALNNAFYTITQQGKQDMEYLAGIYSSAQGDTQQQHETYRGMLALDEYGTRRVKQWLKSSIEPALKQVGEVVKEFSQAVYQAHKVFRIVQPSALQEEKEVEINVPIFNNMGEAIGKWQDYGAAKFDVRIVAGSTLPVNRWAYLAELKELMKLGVVDDLAVLAETDIKDKTAIAKRKSLYQQLQQAVEALEEQVKDKDGTIDTLERQLVQAGIRDKVRTVETELRKGAAKAQGKMALTADRAQADAKIQKEKAQIELQKDKQSRSSNGTKE
tara:strand:- start:10456 stop:12705 length:2250 start_codon:yes stop_codon:yes gene_type:complete